MKLRFILLSFFMLSASTLFAQAELADISSPVYLFLKRMQVRQIIPGYNSSDLPISRKKVADYLNLIKEHYAMLKTADKELLKKFEKEFHYEMTGSLDNSTAFFRDPRIKNVFSSKKKYLYSYADSIATFFLDGTGKISHRTSSGDSIGSHSITLGEAGFRFRGTINNNIGYYLRASNGGILIGDTADMRFAYNTDPVLYSNYKFRIEKENFDTFEGYLRFENSNQTFSAMAGRDRVLQGFGYSDRIFISNNIAPFDFLRLDLGYKALSYSFAYGSLRGDSLGKPLDSKNIAFHRLNVNFSDRVKFGIFESVVISNSPFNFTYLNPLSFLTSAELNKSSQGEEENINNSMLGFDVEVVPVKNIALQGSLLIDDLDFKTLFRDNAKVTNKFAYQLGGFWNEPAGIGGLNAFIEYTKIDPFVYSHASNKSTYTHWDLPIGHHLPPNSDEIAAGLNFSPNAVWTLNVSYLHQRTAGGIVTDTSGNIVVNYGGNILNGYGFANRYPEFLSGNRVNRDICEVNLIIEPVLQYFIEFKFVYSRVNNIFESRILTDKWFFATLRVDY